MWPRSRRARLVLALAVVGAVLALLLAWPAFGTLSDAHQQPIAGGWIKLRERAPQSPVLIVRRHGRTTYVKLPPAKSPGICNVVHWHVRWPFVTVVAQPAEDHGGRIDCGTELDLSVIWSPTSAAASRTRRSMQPGWTIRSAPRI